MQELREFVIGECRERNLTPLIARDFGSRSRNLHDADSDYDIHLVFGNQPSDYIKPSGPTETIDTSNDELDADIMGWDIGKFAQHLSNSNPTAVELLASNETYYIDESYNWAELESIAKTSFKPLALYMHYRSKAKSNYMKYVAETYHDGSGNQHIGSDISTERQDELTEGSTKRTVKRNLFALRAAMLARYVRCTHEFPTIDFIEFCDEYRREFGESDHLSWARQLAFLKKRGYGGDIVGNVAKGFIESEISYDIDHEAHVDRTMPTKQIDWLCEAYMKSFR